MTYDNQKVGHIKGLGASTPGSPRSWLEVISTLACTIGLTGLILIILLQNLWAAAPIAKSNVKQAQGSRPAAAATPNSPSYNPFANLPAGDAAKSRQPAPSGNDGLFDDDDDYDDFDSPLPAARVAKPATPPPPQMGGLSAGGRTFSAGGAPNSTPDPVKTDKGYTIGGAPANGVISKSKAEAVKIDTETAEGSKDLVTDFNFPDADILDIAKTLGKLTGKNFIFDKDVKGRITIVSNSPITVSQAWKVFLTALDINGFALIPSGAYLRVARQRDARDKQLKTYTGDFSPDTDALISRVFSLKYISAEEVARTFRSFMPANSRIISYEQTNTVIVTDTGSNIAKLAKMLEILDIEGYDAGIEVVPVKFASAAELSKLIDALIPGTSTSTPGGGGTPGGGQRFGGGKFSARRTKEGGIINTIIADERTNTLIVHANTKGADQVRELVAKLDQKLPASTGGGKVHVVYLQFADAEQMANTLNNFSSQASIKPTSTGAAGGAGGMGTGVNPVANSLFEGSIKVSPDKSTNALVITASPTDFVTVKRVINRLDIPRDQVYVEVVVMDVNITKGFDFSANLLNASSGIGSITNGDLATFLTSPATMTGGFIPFFAGNQSEIPVGSTKVPISGVMGLVKAIQSKSEATILATPQVIALDNSEALFESSDKIPTLGPSTVANGVTTTPAIQKEPVTLSIKIKPQINKITNFVKLETMVKLGDIQRGGANVPAVLKDSVFATTERSTNTTVVVANGDTVVLGGLIRDKISETQSKIPLLGDIPLLGWLFRSRNTSTEKSNLLIFMTPHIVKQYDSVREILDRKLKERDDFLEETTGGEDKLRNTRDKIIRSLPDLKEIMKQKPENTVTIDEEKPAAVVVPPQTALPPVNQAPMIPPNPPVNNPPLLEAPEADKGGQ